MTDVRRPQATCLSFNPRDLNILLVGYEGGVAAWDFQKASVVKTFEMTLPPGAPGGGSYDDASGSLWTERTPSVSCISWRPDGLVFAVGHTDGCITFWAFAESDKPLMVRTITHEDVNVTDADALLTAGALDTQVRSKKNEYSERDIDGIPIAETSAMRANREPIFKLSWASFPDPVTLKTLMATQGTDANSESLSNATMEYAERQETLLVILGGQSPAEKPGVNVLQFPNYTPPPIKKGAAPPSTSESLPLQDRYAFRDSLMPTGSSYHPTRTPPEDFVLLPRSSPYFGMAHDPISLIVTLTPDPSYASAAGPMAQREILAWAFPPPRTGMPPPAIGRKSFKQPGEDEKLVAMTPAPMMSGSPRASPGLGSGWRLPWTSPGPPSPLSPSLSPRMSPVPRIATPDSIASTAGTSRNKRVKHRRRLKMPTSLWSGSFAPLGCEIYSLPTGNFKKLISWNIEHAGEEDMPRLPVRGGMAVPDLQSHGAPDVKVAKLDSYRVFATWHPDATVRFWDGSPHLLLLPTPLRFEYPGALPHLTINIGEWLRHPDLAHLPLAQLWERDRSKVRIKSVYLAREALECTITMVTGEVFVTKFGPARKSRDEDIEELDDGETSPTDYFGKQVPLPHAGSPRSASSPNVNSPAPQGFVEEVTEIGHLARWKEDGFKPVALFTMRRGEVVQCAVSDIGFIAIAFATKTLAILDMRGPDVILREGFEEGGENLKRRKKKNRNVQNVPAESSLVGTLKWVVSGMGQDMTLRPRLIVSYQKGTTKIYSLHNVLGEWMVEAKPPVFTNESLANPLGSWVISPSTGEELAPTADALKSSMDTTTTSPTKEKNVPAHCIWICAAKRSIRAAINFNGERVAKVELEQHEALSDCYYITRHGQKVFVAVTETGTALFYSMPFLEPITRLDLFYTNQGRRVGRLSIDDRSGDYIEFASPLDINLRTFFHFRKPYPPRIDPTSAKKPVAAQPLPLNAASWVGGLIWGGAPLTGAQLDALVAGPKRPPVPREPPPPPKPLITWGKPPEEAPKPVTPTGAAVLPKRTAVGKQKAPIRDWREREDVYSEMTNATNERGAYLDDLNDSLNNVSMGVANYLSSAKNAAMKEAAKSTAKGVFGKLM